MAVVTDILAAAAGAVATTGFADPVHDAQRVFRAVLAAMARPGTRQPVTVGLTPPPALAPLAAAVALTLVDHETTLWLMPTLVVPAVRDYLVFHSGVRIVPDPAKAGFVLCAHPVEVPPPDRLAQGTPEYPDRSATVVVTTDGALGSGDRTARLSGPGIETAIALRLPGFDRILWQRLQANHARYPLGIDTIICLNGGVCTGTAVIALPRSTRIEI